jgi:site-specific DNA-methyltransferase (adenine-specific)
VTPYYDEDGITIWHGDCREIDAWDIAGGVMVTDPPYGMSAVSGWAKKLIWSDVYGCRGDGSIDGDTDTSVRDHVVDVWSGRPALVFGRYGIDPPAGTRMALVWDKGMAAGMGDLSIAWRPNWELVFVIGTGFIGRRDSGVISGHHNVPRVSMGRCHPHMKPTNLLRDLILKCPPLADVVDPFMGSGTTLRAAKDLGRRAIGVEVEERYCEIAANRLAQGVLDFGASA